MRPWGAFLLMAGTGLLPGRYDHTSVGDGFPVPSCCDNRNGKSTQDDKIFFLSDLPFYPVYVGGTGDPSPTVGSERRDGRPSPIQWGSERRDGQPSPTVGIGTAVYGIHGGNDNLRQRLTQSVDDATIIQNRRCAPCPQQSRPVPG